ncbi:Aromatic-amino-acid aminotransferase [bioreactor metagenome]|uniref:Aromatic-amino-acid aminotransferase n=1 Tax=bioreactor metagenome TaxID=1076179 RepID=A0A644URT2_9ZZZZ|nr:aminotransferase class I/II-fold pyridoxal phosphate-dependent enzyme [Negativicutes bacterium]
MSYSFAASHAKGKSATDKIFGANGAALIAAGKYGKEAVTNATIGALLDDNEVLTCLPTVEAVFKSLPMSEIITYAPIAGLPEYLEAAINLTFGNHKPEAYIDAVATAGGSGVIHHAIWNYTELGDTVLTSDWFWGPYRVLCQEALRKLDTYQLFDEGFHFNIKAFESKVRELIAKQDSLLVIINAPAHNPTGYSLTDSEWDQVIEVCKTVVPKDKRIALLIDVAYLDFAGEPDASRAFMSKFGGLPENILGIFAFSMSKGYTMYGQRCGAMIGVSSNKDVITEFAAINQYTSRATWSNISRSPMRLLATIYQDKALLKKVDSERTGYYQLIRGRADIFMQEAKETNLTMLPYIAGFFLSIPAKNPDAVCDKLHDVNLFAVPLAKGVRIAVCAVTTAKIKGMAGKVAAALVEVDK